MNANLGSVKRKVNGKTVNLPVVKIGMLRGSMHGSQKKGSLISATELLNVWKSLTWSSILLMHLRK